MTGREAAGAPLGEVADLILVARATDGDTEAFGEIVRRHSPIVRAYVWRIVGSLSEADDVVQEAFVIAWRKLPTLRDPAMVRPWLMRIASREAFGLLRRRRGEVSLDVDIVEPQARFDLQPETVAIRNAQLEALAAALGTLPENERRCWLLREIAELSYTEIADEMDIPLSTVRGYLARARSRITSRMEGWR
ncbi:RNA polymerase sigma factor [Microbacterium sp. W1N]|uniref:RNA polymerase sigma factor n=1 Tax=Microbacterium festucae TaxID=2977531 RepID=UPI0021BE3DBC|nr:RNA polymerase sigma factor [Microbacterium festucae]MCT9821428.1 RNA polymerase sigma factor [Microbacterium festucae]